MKVLTGHLTKTEKKAIMAILHLGFMEGQVKNRSYFMTFNNKSGVYTVKIQQKDRGLAPCHGSELRISTYTSMFTI